MLQAAWQAMGVFLSKGVTCAYQRQTPMEKLSTLVPYLTKEEENGRLIYSMHCTVHRV